MTVTELIAKFWRHVESYYRRPDGTPTKEPSAFRVALRPVKRLYGSTPARNFGPLALKAVRQDLIDRGGSRPYVNKLVRRIKLMFKWAASEELVPSSVYHGLQTVAGLIPSEDEWYKAAYHYNNGVTGNYYGYALCPNLVGAWLPNGCPPPGEPHRCPPQW